VVEEQTRGRRGGRRPKVTLGFFEETPEVLQRAFASSDLHHRSNQISNHMVKEAVGGDPQREPQGFPRCPTGLVYRTQVPPLGLARLSEGLEGMFAHDRSGRTLEKLHIQRLGKRPAPMTVEG